MQQETSMTFDWFRWNSDNKIRNKKLQTRIKKSSIENWTWFGEIMKKFKTNMKWIWWGGNSDDELEIEIQDEIQNREGKGNWNAT